MTLICPSQLVPDPIPIVGIFNVSVISAARSLTMLSRTTAVTPAFSKHMASERIFEYSSELLPFFL